MNGMNSRDESEDCIGREDPRAQLHLTLENFDGEGIPEDCPYVLTSPRSLEACKRLCVKPIELLPCSIDEIREHLEEEGDLSFESLLILRDAEDERRQTLEHCRRLRQELIKEEQDLFRLNQIELSNSLGLSRLRYPQSITEEEDEGNEEPDDISVNGSPKRSQSFQRSRQCTDYGRLRSPTSSSFMSSSSSSSSTSSSSSSSSSTSIESSDVVKEGLDSSSPQYSHKDLPEAEQFDLDHSSYEPIKSPSMSTELKQRRIRSRSSTFTKDEQVPSQVENGTSSYAEAVRLVLQRPPRPLSTSITTHTVKSSNRITNDAPIAKPGLPFTESRFSRSHVRSDVVLRTAKQRRPGKSLPEAKTTVLPWTPQVIKLDSRTPSLAHQKKVTGKSSTHELQATDDSTPKNLDKLHQVSPRTPSIDTQRRSPTRPTRVPNWKAPGVPNVRQRRREKSSPSLRLSQKSTFRSHSTSRRSLKMDRPNTDHGEPLLSVKLKDLSAAEIPEVDQKIISILAKKQLAVAEANEAAYRHNRMWQVEHEKWLQDKKIREEALKKSIEEKRSQEAALNDQRLESARQRLSESQELLRRLIEQKDQRARDIRLEKGPNGQDMHVNGRSVDESRRIAVDKALEELLKRDSHYRKELASHLETKLDAADLRRRSRKDQAKKQLQESLVKEQERHDQKMVLIQRQKREEVKRYREDIQSKMGRFTMWQESPQNLKKKYVKHLRQDREHKGEKVRQLRSELEGKMSDWRRQVLAVQSESLQRAEEKALKQLSHRKHRVASRNRIRERKHSQKRQEVENEERVVEVEGRRQIMEKQAKVERLLEERERELKRNRERALKLAEIRDQIKQKINPNSFDQMVARVQMELRTTQGSPAINNRYV